MTTTYLIVATCIFLFLAIIWDRKSFTNLLFKTVFWVMGLIGGVITLTEMGYIIHVVGHQIN